MGSDLNGRRRLARVHFQVVVRPKEGEGPDRRDPHVGGSGEAARRVGWRAEVGRGRKAARVREEAGAAVGSRPKKNWARKRKNPAREEFNPFFSFKFKSKFKF